MSAGQEANSKPSATCRMANASEARSLTRQMHKRVPAWKLQMCIEALTARPIDQARVAEVTEIQFANDELVVVAAQCLVDLAREGATETPSVQTDEDTADFLNWSTNSRCHSIIRKDDF